MKKILDIIEMNSFLNIIFKILWFITFPFILVGFCLAPIVIGKSILGFDMSNNVSGWCFLCILWSIGIFKYGDDDKRIGKVMIFIFIIGIFSSSVTFFDMYSESLLKNSDSNTPSASYHFHREPSPSYSYHDTHSSSNYRHSNPTYTPPTKISDDDVIPHSQQIKIEENVATEPLIIPKDDEEYNNQSFSESSDVNPEQISPQSSETGLSDSWKYVTSDEQGNKYYINKNFGVYSTVTSIEGNVFSASFRKVLSNDGREVEILAYDINRGMITEKKIVAYEESVIRFRNRNGFREIKFSTISGYTTDNSIVVGYIISKADNILKWQPINDKVYNALYDSAYKKL